jgi:predicted tellurium resistance membrane protein TerC
LRPRNQFGASNEDFIYTQVIQYETCPLTLSFAKRSKELTIGLMDFTIFSSDFFVGVITVIIIDIVLAGDNAVVIAMAAKSLPQDKKRLVIVFGSLLAVLLRIALTVFAAQLLQISLVKLIGGLLIIWIGVKLLVVDDGLKGKIPRTGPELHTRSKMTICAALVFCKLEQTSPVSIRGHFE